MSKNFFTYLRKDDILHISTEKICRQVKSANLNHYCLKLQQQIE